MVPDSISCQVSSIYKAKCGEPYQNWTRLKCHTMLRKSDFVVFWLEKFGAPSGPSVWDFLRHLLFFSANGARAHPGQNPEYLKIEVYKNLIGNIQKKPHHQVSCITSVCFICIQNHSTSKN